MTMLIDAMNTFSFNYPNGEPQTPTRTPTSGAFGDTTFQTPKFESSFYDPRVTWDTADPYASSPELLKTPQRFAFGTPSHSMQPLDASFGQHISPNVTAKGPVDTDTAKRKRAAKPNTNFVEEGPGTVNSTRSAATIQTPPPTSTSRRRAGDPADEGQGFVESAKRLSAATETHLETPSRIIGASPHLFPNLENSPDLFRFSTINQSTSPFFPQQKLFLDQDANDFSHLSTDPFGGANNDFSTAINAASHPQSLDVPPLPTIHGSLDLSEFSHDPSFGMGTTTPADAALFPAPFSTSPRVLIAKADDPSLFLSSPARRFGPPQAVSEPRTAPRPSRQPYHHQTEEAKREQQRRTSQVDSRPPSGSFSGDEGKDDDFTPRAQGFRPSLNRSHTTTAITSLSSHSRQQSQLSFASSHTSSSGVKKVPPKGRVSPVKTMRQPLPRSNSSCLPTRSQSLILKIDKDGRAKTEFQAPGSNQFTGLTDPISEMDIDGSATESESDSAEFSDYPAVQSTNNSFAFSGLSLTKPQLSRTGSISRPNSKSSYASSSLSGRRSPWADSRPKRPQSAIIPSEWTNTPRRFSIPSNANFTRNSASTDSTLPDPDEDSGDAQHALRQVLQGRGRNTVGRYAGGRMPVSQSMNHLPSSPPGMGRFDIGSGDSTTSPTTLTDPDLGTPNSDRRTNPGNGTRCVCKSMENGGHLMIQCESCNHWLHTKCVGLNRSNLPPVYICVYCCSTPMRGGRIRDPLVGTSHAASSPLARKSFRYR
ncbi:PHD finger domain protein [Talaromyces proteolyticus]|uniref:PHD finger domain protein n=1 Tax=Talaromyces proteolyticus TaxID=1131652 RepID=A0AAD4Q222_9EURO|nr:PHD finger domain protein [Talaromyces proteolyticus]KAH8699163.1 PHD finger domain protein [Talaromyces proteolyticus]